MKEGWEIKKLGEVSSLITDGDWIESRHQSEEGIRLIQTGNIGCGVFKAKDDKPHYISEETFEELGCTEIFSGDCLVSRLPEPVGRACLIPNMDCRMITAVDCTVIRFKEILKPELFVYYSQSVTYQRDINNNTTGTTRKRISRKNLEQVSIPVPPLPEQEKIVSELDCLSGIIEKKRQQLKELDALAQSIFYEMFGNPVDNERGWEVKKLGEVCDFSQGIQIDVSLQSTENREGLNRFLRIVDYTTCNTDIRYVDVSNKKYFVELDDVVVVRYGASAGFVGMDKEGVLANNLFKLNHNRDILNHKYLYYLLSTDYYKSFIKDIAFGAAMPALSFSSFKLFKTPLPPLPLQQSFAQKIEAIEQQKALIKQSIAEVETLFNARMQEYFE